MPRNASGTYSLPSGNPVVSGNIIEASWANSTLSDLATEMTNSLSRTGAGGMTGPLRLADGSASVPGLAWVSETGTGFYRANLNDIRFVVATNLVQQWTASGSSITGTLTASGQVRGGGTSGAQFLGNDITYANSRVFFATQGDGTQRINVGHYDSSALSFPTGLVPAQILAGVTDLNIATRDVANAALVFRAGPGVPEQARIKADGGITSANAADAMGYKGLPINSQTANYTLVIGDQSKTILHPASDNNPRTFTIPANASVAFPVGTAVTFINLVNTITIAITSDTMYLAGVGFTGSRTLGPYGVATAVKVNSTTWVISGNGLT